MDIWLILTILVFVSMNKENPQINEPYKLNIETGESFYEKNLILQIIKLNTWQSFLH